MIKHELARYDAYKDSGVGWLGEVPDNWGLKRLVDVSFVIDPQPDHRAPAIAEIGGYPYIGIRDLNEDGSLNFETARKVELSAVEKQECSFKVVSGDILFCKVGTLGEPRIVVPKGRFALSATLVLIKLKNKESNVFLRYALDSSCVFDQINHFGSGSTRPALGIKQIRKFCFPFPSLLEQKAIADYLDTKTVQIDCKIDLLTQKATQYGKLKQSLINETVTRGLDKNVAMKDSGVEWIGEVPEHWSIIRLKDVGKSIIGITYSPDDVLDSDADGILVLRSANIQEGKLSLSNNVFVNKKISKKQIVRLGDILICSRNGSRNLIGKNICIDERVAGQTFGAFMTVYRSKYFRFIQNFFNTQVFESQSGLFMSSTINQLTVNTLNNFIFMLPPLTEQKAIADYLDTKTAHIDRIVETINTHIDKLKELRKTLINDVVTGKIKVA